MRGGALGLSAAYLESLLSHGSGGGLVLIVEIAVTQPQYGVRYTASIRFTGEHERIRNHENARIKLILCYSSESPADDLKAR